MNETHSKLMKLLIICSVVYGIAAAIVAFFLTKGSFSATAGVIVGVVVMLINLRLLIFAGEDYLKTHLLARPAMVYVIRLLLYGLAGMICWKTGGDHCIIGYGAGVLGSVPGLMCFALSEAGAAACKEDDK